MTSQGYYPIVTYQSQMNKTTVNQVGMQARKIALAGNYDNIPRILKDVHAIINKYETFYPTSVERNGLQGKLTILSLTGHIKTTHPVKKRTCLLNIKITFPKDYPKGRPSFLAENPNQQMHDRNVLYQNYKLARYQKSSDNGRMIMYLEFPEIKLWNTSTDILKVLSDIEKRFNENFPWVTKEHVKGQGIKSTYVPSNIHPQLRRQVEKVETQMAEFESDFQLLMGTRKQMIVSLASAEVQLQEMSIKQKEFTKNSNYFVEVHQKINAMHLDQTTIDKFLRITPEHQKILELSSQKEALQECLNYLKQQLKQGTKLSEIKDPLKRVYEDMFTNQVYLNQL